MNFQLTDSKTVVFALSLPPDEENIEAISELNLILNKFSAEIKTKCRDGRNYLVINFDTVKAHEYLSRRAGRHEKCIESELTVGEVRKMMENCSSEDVARKLGISRATLFRRLKKDDELYF